MVIHCRSSVICSFWGRFVHGYDIVIKIVHLFPLEPATRLYLLRVDMSETILEFSKVA
jgi:hypothetical protein